MVSDMSLLDRARSTLPSSATVREPRDWWQLAIAAGYGAVGAVTLGLVLIAPVMAAWAADPHSSVPWTDALSFSGDGWALAHRGHVSVAAGAAHTVTFAPLMLTALAVVFARMAATAMLTHLSGRSGAWWEGLSSYVLGYVVTGLLISGLSMSGPAHPNPLTVLPGAVAVGFAGCAWALLRSDEPVAEQARGFVDDHVSMSTRRALRPAAQGVLGHLVIGLVIVLVLAMTHASQIGQVNGQLEPGVLGGVVLWLGQLTALPNLVLWAGGWTTGASVQLGAVSVGSTSVHGGLLPLIPVLGAVPGAGPLPGGANLAPLLPVLLGCFVGHRSLSNLTTYASLKTKATTAAQAGGMAAAMVLLLTWLSTAGVSGGSLDYLGPSLLMVPLLVGELLLGALVATLFLHWKRALRR